MKIIFLFLFVVLNLFAVSAIDLGMTETDFNFLSGLTGLLTSILLVSIIYHKV